MAQVTVAREQEQHIAQVHLAQHQTQVTEYTAERYQEGAVMEAEVCRAVALEVIAHETQTGRSVH